MHLLFYPSTDLESFTRLMPYLCSFAPKRVFNGRGLTLAARIFCPEKGCLIVEV